MIFSSTMTSITRLTIIVIFGVVTSQNHDVNLQTQKNKRSVKATTPIPSDLTIKDEGLRFQLSRLESLCVENFQFLLTETNSRLEALENKLSQGSSCPASPVIQNIKNLEAKVENLEKKFIFLENVQEFMDATRNLPSDVEMIKQNVSSLIKVTRLLVDLPSNSELNQIFNKGLQELKDFQIATSKSLLLNFTQNKLHPRNCREVRKFEKTACGTYMIQPQHAPKPFEVICDLETRGGGWTVIQRRFDGSQDFYLDWQHYKNGFGNLLSEFWLGLENIYLLTGFEDNELLIELSDFESKNISAFYSKFRIGSEKEEYALKVLGGYSGDAGNSMDFQYRQKFTTKDKDQDSYPEGNCAEYNHGGWWYQNCASSNLNGMYFQQGQVSENIHHRIFWYEYNGRISLKHTRMLVRPKANNSN